jgi:predicted anti-sigma-YlaC factor YlaD
MNCRQVKRLLSSLADGELPVTQRQLAQEHLAGCSSCRMRLEECFETRRRIATLRHDTVSGNITQTVMARIRGESLKRPVRSVWFRFAFGGVAVALAVLLLAHPWDTGPDARAVMARAYSATMSVRSFVIEANSVGIQGDVKREVSYSISQATNGDSHTKTMSGGAVSETIKSGSDVFTSGSDIAVTLGDVSYSLNFDTPSKDNTLTLLNSLIDVRRLPDEIVGGVPAYRFVGKVDTTKGYSQEPYGLDPNDPDTELKERLGFGGAHGWPRILAKEVEIWVGKEDFLPRQVLSQSDFMTVEPAGAPILIATTVRYHSFDEPIVVEKPLMPSGDLMPGWHRVSVPDVSSFVFAGNIGFSIDDIDSSHQRVRYDITLTNRTSELLSNVQVLVSTPATNAGVSVLKATSNSAEPVNIAPGRSHSFSVSWHYDSSDSGRQELSRLLPLTTASARYTTSTGGQEEQSLTPFADQFKSPAP